MHIAGQYLCQIWIPEILYMQKLDPRHQRTISTKKILNLQSSPTQLNLENQIQPSLHPAENDNTEIK